MGAEEGAGLAAGNVSRRCGAAEGERRGESWNNREESQGEHGTATRTASRNEAHNSCAKRPADGEEEATMRGTSDGPPTHGWELWFCCWRWYLWTRRTRS